MQDPKKDDSTQKPATSTPAAEPSPEKAGPEKAGPGKSGPGESDGADAVTKAIPAQKAAAPATEAATVKMRRTPQQAQDEQKQPSDAKTVAIPVSKPSVPTAPPPPRPAADQPAASPPPAPQPAPPRPAGPPPKAAPQRILPPKQNEPQRIAPAAAAPKKGGEKKRGRAWLFAAIAAGVLVIAAIAVAGVVVYNNNGENSAEAQVQETIDTFVAALTQGDLATLRASTCGALADYYQGIPDREFADVHRMAVTQQNVPVVGGVDAVQITGETAIAQVKAHTAANPGEQSWRTFNLEKIDGTWKICDPR